MQFLGLIARLLRLNLLDPCCLLLINFLKARLELLVASLLTQEHILHVLPNSVALGVSHGLLLVDEVLSLLGTCKLTIGQG